MALWLSGIGLFCLLFGLDVVSSREPRSAAAQSASMGPTRLPERYELMDSWHAGMPYPGVYHPEGVDIADDGLIYVAERGNHQISVWGFAGSRYERFGSRGDGDTQFDAPEDLAVDIAANLLYVADTGNGRVQVVNRRSGVHSATWTDLGRPRGIALKPGGPVYVSDAASHKIHVINADGSRVAEWGGFGNGPTEFDTPLGLAYGPGDKLYVADHGNQRVQVLDAASGDHVETYRLDNAEHPGGAPSDVGIDASGTVLVSVDWGVLRFSGPGSFRSVQPPLKEYFSPECQATPRPCGCRDVTPELASLEGVRRLAVHPDVGMVFSYAPALRYQDRIIGMPRRGFPRVFPSAVCDSGGVSPRHAFDMHRLDAGADPQALHVLDRTELLRIYNTSGTWFDRFRRYEHGPGVDIASDFSMPNISRVVSGNQVNARDLTCFSNCGSLRTVLDPSMLTVRDLAGNLVPDYRWWLRSIAADGNMAVLDAGMQRVILRAPNGQLVAGAALNQQNAKYRAFSDLAFDTRRNLRVLARDGWILGLTSQGRDLDPVELIGLGERSLESLAIGFERGGNRYFVLTSDGWVFKFDPEGGLLAAWDIAALDAEMPADPDALKQERLSGFPGRYTDITIDELSRVMVTDSATDRVLIFMLAVGEDDPPPPLRGGPCELRRDKRAAPGQIPLGASVNVSLTLEVDCGSEHAMLDVVVALDASCQMTGERLSAARRAGETLIDAMRLDQDHVGLVSFNDQIGSGRLLEPLSADRGRLRSALGSYSTDCQPVQLFPDRRNDARISEGLRLGREALYGPAGRDGAGKVLILISPSTIDREIIEVQQFGRRLADVILPPLTDRSLALFEASRLWTAGARVFTVAPGEPSRKIGRPPTPTPDLQSTQPSDRGLLSALAMPASAYSEAADELEMRRIFGDLGDLLSDRVLLRSLVITDSVPANMRLQPGSTNPIALVLPPDRPGASALLKWEFRDIGFDGPPALEYVLTPQEAGRWPTNIEARAVFTDGLDHPGELLFPVPEVEVLAPSPTPTPSPESSPTLQPSPSPSVTPSPVASPSPTPTREPIPIYLPFLLRERCVPGQKPLDIALVLDTSSSMNGEKLEAARAAASTFIALLNLEQDRAGLVSFDNVARLEQELTGDEAALNSALARLTTAVGTRIDAGLWAALSLLRGPSRRQEADGLIILLTDGRPHAGSEPSMREAARLARDLGIEVYAIGLGADVLHAGLVEIAGDPSRVFISPDADGLAEIYGEVARVLPCR